MKPNDWGDIVPKKDFLPTNYNPRRFFEGVVRDTANIALGVLNNGGVSFEQKSDVTGINGLKEVLNNVLKLNNKELIIDIIINALNPNRPISDIIEIFFLLKEFDLVQDLYLRFIHQDSGSMLSNSQVYKNDIGRITSDFEEILVQDNDNITIPETQQIIKKSFLDHHLICGYNCNGEESLGKMDDLVFVLLKTIIEKINFDEKLLSGYIDSLTKLPNRTALIRNIHKLEKDNTPTGMMVIDIDNFKDINDKNSDNLIEKILIAFSNILSNVLKKYNGGLYRLNGEKFVVIVPESTGIDQIIDISKEIYRELIRNSILFDNGESYNIKFSAGVGFKEGEGDIDLWKLWTMLEKCKYQTKYLQGNGITVFQKEYAKHMDNIKNGNNGDVLFFGEIPQLIENNDIKSEDFRIHYLGGIEKVIIG